MPRSANSVAGGVEDLLGRQLAAVVAQPAHAIDQRDGERPAHVAAGRPGDAARFHVERRDPREQLLERDPRHHPRGGVAEAVVAALAEGEELRRAAAHVELVGVRAVAARVAVGRGVRQQHLATGRDPYAVQLDVAGGGAGQPLDRRGEPQELLDRALDQARVGDEERALVGSLGEQLDRAAEGAGRGVVAAGDHREDVAEDAQQPGVVVAHARRDQVRHGVVGSSAGSLRRRSTSSAK